MEQPKKTAESGSDEVVCVRCNERKVKLPKPPFKGPLGEQVAASVCPDCWRAWIQMGTRVINELRLDFANPAHSRIYDQYLREFLKLA